MLDRFAKLLGIRPDQAEDALRSERVAKHVVSRRSFFGAAAALAGGTLFSFGGVDVAEPVVAKNPLLEQLQRFAAEMRKFKPLPHSVFMNPHDYEQLRAMLPNIGPDGWGSQRIVTDANVTRGVARGVPQEWLDSFKGVDRSPLKVGASIIMSGIR